MGEGVSIGYVLLRVKRYQVGVPRLTAGEVEMYGEKEEADIRRSSSKDLLNAQRRRVYVRLLSFPPPIYR